MAGAWLARSIGYWPSLRGVGLGLVGRSMPSSVDQGLAQLLGFPPGLLRWFSRALASSAELLPIVAASTVLLVPATP